MGPTNDSKAGNAIDGQLMVKSYPNIYHSQAVGEYWTLTLQKPTAITSIIIYNRDQNNCCSDRLNGAIIQLFDVNGVIMTTITLNGDQRQAYNFNTELPYTKCNYQMSPTEIACYKNRYPDLSSLNTNDLQGQWSNDGCKQNRDNQCNNPIETTSGLYNYKGCYNNITDSNGKPPTNNGLITSVDQCQTIATNNKQNIFALNNKNCYTMGTLNSDATLNFDRTQCNPMGGQKTNQVYTRNTSYVSASKPPILKSQDISSTTGKTEHFIGANGATTKNSSKLTAPIDTSNILTRGYNQLYNQIFCNLFNLPQNFNKCTDCNYTYNTDTSESSSGGYATNTTYPLKYVKDPVSLTSEQKVASEEYVTSVGSGPLCRDDRYTFDNSTGNSRCIPTSETVLGTSGCQTLCYNDPYCSSYNYNTSSGDCRLNNAVPNQITSTPDTGINSGYSIDYNYDYSTLSSEQQNNVKMKCANQYLNNTFTKSKYQDLSKCLTIRDVDSSTGLELPGVSIDGQSTTFDIDPKCFYDLYKGAPTIVDNSIYIDNKDLQYAGKSHSDQKIDSYKTKYDNYNEILEKTRRNISVSGSDISKNKQLSKEYIDSITNEINNLKNNKNNIYKDLNGMLMNKINDSDDHSKKMHVEKFDNIHNKLSMYQIISIVLIIIILIAIIFFIFKKK